VGYAESNCAFPPLVSRNHRGSDHGSRAAVRGRRRLQVVVTKEVTMNDTIRAFLYGLLILTAALIPPTLSVIDLIEKLVGS